MLTVSIVVEHVLEECFRVLFFPGILFYEVELRVFFDNMQIEPLYAIDYAVTLSKAAILGIALGALVILLMILLAACRPYNPSPYPDGSLDKPGIFIFISCVL